LVDLGWLMRSRFRPPTGFSKNKNWVWHSIGLIEFGELHNLREALRHVDRVRFSPGETVVARLVCLVQFESRDMDRCSGLRVTCSGIDGKISCCPCCPLIAEFS